MKKLWQKNYQLNTCVETFETKGDLLLDPKLLTYDLMGTLAHGTMLHKMGLLTKKELSQLQEGIQKIHLLYTQNKFTLFFGEEDIHTKIEHFLTKEYGELGKKIHTGRSRNDQVLTALRLYTKDHILCIWEKALICIETALAFSKKYQSVPMPGYTHMQKAMPYSVGAWMMSFVSGLLDDLHALYSGYQLIDQSPLGSAAGYGAPITLDKAYSAELLGFSTIQNNSLACQNSRGKLEAFVIATCMTLLSDMNKLATDILVFTTSEFDFFSVDDTITTGSSIMPQKKNVDLAELIRSKVHVVSGNYISIVGISTNLMSGYNRDLQDMKKPLFESLEITQNTLQATTILLEHISPKQDKLKKALTPELFATHKAIELTKKGVPFRQAYQHIAQNIETLVVKKPVFYLKQAKNSGETGNLQLEVFEKKLADQKQVYETYASLFAKHKNKLLQKGGEKK